MKYSIFHTSHCGSTLLASLLSQVVTTYTEPEWTHSAVKDCLTKLPTHLHADETLVKYPSIFCPHILKVPGKKVFLFRTLREHVIWMSMRNYYQIGTHYYEFMEKFKHPKLYDMSPITREEKEIFLWLNRIFWVQEESRVFWIPSEKFFKEKEKVTNSVSDFFTLKSVKDFSICGLNVKKASYNHSDVPVNELKPSIIEATGPTYGVINPLILEASSLARDSMEYVLTRFPYFNAELL